MAASQGRVSERLWKHSPVGSDLILLRGLLEAVTPLHPRLELEEMFELAHGFFEGAHHGGKHLAGGDAFRGGVRREAGIMLGNVVGLEQL